MDIKNNLDTQKHILRKIGVWILIYDILCVGVVGFIINFGLALGIGDSGIIYSLNFFSNFLVQLFSILVGSGFTFGLIFLLAGGIGFLFNKKWSRKVSIIGIWLSFSLAIGSVALAFTCAVIQWGFSPYGGDFAFITLMAAIVAIPGIFILKKIKKEFPDESKLKIL